MAQDKIQITEFKGAKAAQECDRFANEAIRKGWRVHPPSVAVDKMLNRVIILMIEK